MLTGLILLDGVFMSELSNNRESKLQEQIRVMDALCSEVIVVAQEPKLLYEKLDLRVRLIADCIPGNGPLSSLYSGFSLAQFTNVWVANGEEPTLNSYATELLLKRRRTGLDAVIPLLNGINYPLYGIYNRNCAMKAFELLNRGKTDVEALLQEICWSSLSDEAISSNSFI